MIWVIYSGMTTLYRTTDITNLPHITFLSRVSKLTRDIDTAILSVCPSVRDTLVLYENGLTYRHSFLPGW